MQNEQPQTTTRLIQEASPSAEALEQPSVELPVLPNPRQLRRCRLKSGARRRGVGVCLCLRPRQCALLPAEQVTQPHQELLELMSGPDEIKACQGAADAVKLQVQWRSTRRRRVSKLASATSLAVEQVARHVIFGSSHGRAQPVSYTHLTLPTTPYV